VQTNMVFITPKPGTAVALAQALYQRGIMVDPGGSIRMVTHLDVSRDDVLATAAAIKAFYC